MIFFNKSIGRAPRYKGFTLAEVLITLGIIGIVAMLTIPSLVKEYEKKVTAEKVKIAYLMLEDAITKAEAQYGPRQLWNWDPAIGPLDAPTYLDLNYVKKCTGGLGANECWKTQEDKIKYLTGSAGWFTGWGGPNHVFLVMENGMLVWFHYYSWILVDINGNTGPNTWGRDIFIFYGSSKPIFPGSGGSNLMRTIGRNDSCTKLSTYTRDDIKNGTGCVGGVVEGCNKTDGKAGVNCAALIVKDNFKIEDDYPWK